jgi:hypothetical protein
MKSLISLLNQQLTSKAPDLIDIFDPSMNLVPTLCFGHTEALLSGLWRPVIALLCLHFRNTLRRLMCFPHVNGV